MLFTHDEERRLTDDELKLTVLLIPRRNGRLGHAGETFTFCNPFSNINYHSPPSRFFFLLFYHYFLSFSPSAYTYNPPSSSFVHLAAAAAVLLWPCRPTGGVFTRPPRRRTPRWPDTAYGVTAPNIFRIMVMVIIQNNKVDVRRAFGPFPVHDFYEHCGISSRSPVNLS